MANITLPSFRPLKAASVSTTGPVVVADMEEDEYTYYNNFINDSLTGSDSTQTISDYLEVSTLEDSGTKPVEFDSITNDVEFGQYLDNLIDMYQEWSPDGSVTANYHNSEVDSDSGDEEDISTPLQDTFDELELVLYNDPSDDNKQESFTLGPSKEVLDAAIAVGDCNFTTSRVNAYYLRWLLYGGDNVYQDNNYSEFDSDEEGESVLEEDEDEGDDCGWLDDLCAEVENELEQEDEMARQRLLRISDELIRKEEEEEQAKQATVEKEIFDLYDELCGKWDHTQDYEDDEYFPIPILGQKRPLLEEIFSTGTIKPLAKKVRLS